MTPTRVIIHVISAFVSIVVFAPLLWMRLDRLPPYEMTGGMIEPENPHPGEQVEIVWDLKVLRACPAEGGASVTRTLVDNAGVEHNYVPVPATYDSRTGQTEIMRRFTLPEKMPVGPATYYAVACYPCNPAQAYLPEWISGGLVCVKTPGVHFNVSETW